MEKKKQKMPDAALGKFMIGASAVLLAFAVFFPGVDFGRRCFGASTALMGWSWGSKTVAAAKKWKQKYGEPDLSEQMDMKKRHSILNLPILAWLVLSIAALALLGFVFTLFHH